MYTCDIGCDLYFYWFVTWEQNIGKYRLISKRKLKALVIEKSQNNHILFKIEKYVNMNPLLTKFSSFIINVQYNVTTKVEIIYC